MPTGVSCGRGELLAEGEDFPERSGPDPGGQVMHARFVLRWLAGELARRPPGDDRPHPCARERAARRDHARSVHWVLSEHCG